MPAKQPNAKRRLKRRVRGHKLSQNPSSSENPGPAPRVFRILPPRRRRIPPPPVEINLQDIKMIISLLQTV